MTGYELAERLARVLGLQPLEYGDANQIVNAAERIQRSSDLNAVPLVSYMIGLGDVSPTSFSQYVDMVASAAELVQFDDDERWTVYQYQEEAARLMSKSQLTESECEQLLDNLREGLMVSEELALPLITYLAGRAHLSPSEIGQRIGEAIRAEP